MQNAVAKGTECHGRLVAIRPVGELDLQDRNVVDDGSGNGGDENENRGRKEEEGPNVVNDAGPSHLDGIEGGLSIWLVQDEVEGWDVFACGGVVYRDSLYGRLQFDNNHARDMRLDEVCDAKRQPDNKREGDVALFSF
jgi:hypothetical protein